MKCTNAAIVVTALLTLSHTWARTPEAPNNHRLTDGLSATSPGLKVGESFLAARSRILKIGWHPTIMLKNANYIFFDIEKELKDRDLTEFDSCTMDAGVLCMLYYNKETRCLRVDTIGEHVKDMKVIGWSDECPEEGRSAKD